MRETQLMHFEESGIIAMAAIDGKTDFLDIDERGLLIVPKGVEPKGFRLVIAVGDDSRTFPVQKDVAHEGGGYSDLDGLKEFAPGVRAMTVNRPIIVERAKDKKNAREIVWTKWHATTPNRVDCYHLGSKGQLDLFQVGVYTHDNGATWKFYGGYRFRGQLVQNSDGVLIGLPQHAKWQAFDGGTSNRNAIFEHPEFVALLADADIPVWNPTATEIDPPLADLSVLKDDEVLMQWWIIAAGQNGQGPGWRRDGSTVWVHGIDIEGFEPNLEEPPLWRGDIVSFTGVEQFGNTKGKPPKITGVKLVKRTW